MESNAPKLSVHAPAQYRIRVQGTVDESWSDYYGGMTMKSEAEGEPHPETTLSGELMDQAALIGALTRLYDMRLPILSVEYLPEGR